MDRARDPEPAQEQRHEADELEKPRQVAERLRPVALLLARRLRPEVDLLEPGVVAREEAVGRRAVGDLQLLVRREPAPAAEQRRVDGFQRQEDARPHERADFGLPGDAFEPPRDAVAPLPDADGVAHGGVVLLHERRVHERLAVGLVRPRRLGRHRLDLSIKRDRPARRHHAHEPRPARQHRHRRELDAPPALDGLGGGEAVQQRLVGLGERGAAEEPHVGAEELLRLRFERAVEVAPEGADGDERRHAERHRGDEQQQLAARAPAVAPGELEGEHGVGQRLACSSVQAW